MMRPDFAKIGYKPSVDGATTPENSEWLSP